MRDFVTTALEVAGGALVAAGMAMIWLPLGVICAGALLITIGALTSR
jgi:hypothetical protein